MAELVTSRDLSDAGVFSPTARFRQILPLSERITILRFSTSSNLESCAQDACFHFHRHISRITFVFVCVCVVLFFLIISKRQFVD